MKFMLVSVTCLCLALAAFAGDGLDSLLNAQRDRAKFTPALFEWLDATAPALSPAELADARFLLAYMPLSDLSGMTPGMLLDNIRLARRSLAETRWGAQLPEGLYRHFVLPHRVSQEPFVNGWRETFFRELLPRVRDLSMTDAALEVNHWCHEVATYKPSDSRDQDPLTTIRAGLGRCEEEMILTICALRAVGIPARQCYTPYWAHCDDNHAWTEVWADGKWHYFGACEPEPVLDKGWFTDAARRAMLVVSTAYGNYEGNEPVLKRNGSTTLINSTSVYGKTHWLRATLTDPAGKPVVNGKIVFSLFNYGSLMPALSLNTDAQGSVTLECGAGTWIISAGQDSLAAMLRAGPTDTLLTLRLQPAASLAEFTAAEYLPPPAMDASKSVEQDSLFRCRTAREDSLRENLWSIWAAEAGLPAPAMKQPDSAAVYGFALPHGLDAAALLECFRDARGNWGHLCNFLTGQFPAASITTQRSRAELAERWLLLSTLSEKDRRDFSGIALEDHLSHSSVRRPYQEVFAGLATLDSSDRARVVDYVLCPRIDQEPSSSWRQRLCESLLLSSHIAPLSQSENDQVFLEWYKGWIGIDTTRDRMGAPHTPLQTLSMKRGSQRDVENLYAAFCRVRELPARRSPVSDKLERWDSGHWTVVEIAPNTPGQKKTPQGSGELVVTAAADSILQSSLYFKDWCCAAWSQDHLSAVDFGYQAPYKDLSWPQALPVGLYCLSSGFRRADGSAAVRMRWFDLRTGQKLEIPLSFAGN